MQKPGSDLDEEEEEEDVARMEQGEDLWQTRRDDAAAERGPGEPALGGAEAGEVRSLLPLRALLLWVKGDFPALLFFPSFPPLA